MNKKGISIIEIISVIIIIAVIVLLLFPKKTTEDVDTSKNGEYLKEVKEMVNKANLMYQNSTYLNDANYFKKVNDNTYSIVLNKIVGISDYLDPYGYLYDKEDTKITYIKNADKTEIMVNAKSCDPNLSDGIHKCYEIVNENYKNLTENSVKNTVH